MIASARRSSEMMRIVVDLPARWVQGTRSHDPEMQRKRAGPQRESQTSSSTTPLTVEILGHRELVGQWAVVAGECPQDAHLPITGHQAQRRGMPSSSI